MIKKGIWVVVIFLIFIIVTISIYFYVEEEGYYIIALGDSLAHGTTPYRKQDASFADFVAAHYQEKGLLTFFTKEFTKPGHRSNDLMKDIKLNRYIKVDSNKLYLKTAIYNADIIMISIGANDLFRKLGIKSVADVPNLANIERLIDDIIVDLDELFLEIANLSSGHVFVIGYYDPIARFNLKLSESELNPIIYANKELARLANAHGMHFIDIYDLFRSNPEFLPNRFNIHPSLEGYQAIADKIINHKSLLN